MANAAGRLLQRPGHVLHGLRERRALARRSHRGRPGVARTGDLLAALSRRRSSKRAPSSCACCARARKSLRRSRSRSATRSPKAPSTCAAATALNTRLAESSQALQTFAQNPVVTVGLRRLHADAAVRQPAARRARAGAGVLQLPDAGLPQRREPAVGEHRRRHARRAPAPCSRRAGRTTRASRPRRRPTARRSKKPSSARRTIVDNNHVHANPYPNVAGPGQPQVCEAGNETYEPGKAVIGNLPAAQRRQEPRNHQPRTEPVRRKVPGRARSRTSASRRPSRRRRKGRRNEPRCAAGAATTKSRSSSCSRYQPGALRDRVPGDRRSIAVYFGFTKHIPFKHGFRLNAQFASAREHQTQVAGAHRGRQRRQGDRRSSARASTGAGERWKSNRAACRSTPTRPSRSARASSSKATGSSNCSPAARRPRRSPRAPRCRSRRPSDPVQLDQVLDALNTDTRANLQDFLIGYGDGLTRKPNAGRQRRTGPRGARDQRGRRRSTRPTHRAPSAAARRRDHQPGARRHRTARPLEARRRASAK